MHRSRILAALAFSAVTLLGGCALPPVSTQELMKNLPSRAPGPAAESFTPALLDAVRETYPTEALYLDAVRHTPLHAPGVHTDVVDQRGWHFGAADPEDGAIAARGAAIGGRTGGGLMLLGALLHSQSDAKVNSSAVATYGGYDAPTLDFYRPLSSREMKTPINRQVRLYDEEYKLASMLHGVKPDTFMGSPCDSWIFGFDPKSDGSSEGSRACVFQHKIGDFKGTADFDGFEAVADLGFHLGQHDKADLPGGIGDNGYIVVGMQSPTETAFVLSGEWPRNQYMSSDRLKALERADPDMRNWYAVFNEPFTLDTAGADKPAVRWVVMYHDQVIASTGAQATAAH
jgi:hypothetical protein